ncbi:peptidase inhibitor family I36 protein [Streptomyces yaizuensis]|uniref:Peptidase inhibitor family I36 protein n=1 Tax=Streptomyces yaizuensis TaxID=2989713 RepID=A0ABQ5NTL4_9ACTN|nr:peptidase inhibitor family I36 protein [Streptomyces sp. YSPA8]GLF93700.1 peptidase inhibitor family I36 protein [Streptomyces sp. YSPA8]
MRRIALLTAALALATPLTTASPARAAGTVTTFAGSHCPPASLCLYRDYDFTGGGIALTADTYVGRLGDHGFNDQMSSWSNDTGLVCDWWEHADRGRPIHDMRPGYRVNVLPRENDTASAVECW